MAVYTANRQVEQIYLLALGPSFDDCLIKRGQCVKRKASVWCSKSWESMWYLYMSGGQKRGLYHNDLSFAAVSERVLYNLTNHYCTTTTTGSTSIPIRLCSLRQGYLTPSSHDQNSGCASARTNPRKLPLEPTRKPLSYPSPGYY
jgi:hypothetical protein